MKNKILTYTLGMSLMTGAMLPQKSEAMTLLACAGQSSRWQDSQACSLLLIGCGVATLSIIGIVFLPILLLDETIDPNLVVVNEAGLLENGYSIVEAEQIISDQAKLALAIKDLSQNKKQELINSQNKLESLTGLVPNLSEGYINFYKDFSGTK